MAEDLNISRSKVSSWETGRREMSLYDAIVISDYFEVSMDNLFNKKSLNSEQVVQIVKRYFNNDKISLDEKKETLKKMLYFLPQTRVTATTAVIGTVSTIPILPASPCMISMPML